jgi:peroxin-4
MNPVTRLMRELKEARKSNDVANADLLLSTLKDDDMFRWKAMLKGPPDTPFVGGTYEVELQVPSDYPIVPPTAKFKTKVFHPNVKFDTGEICLDILKSTWSPAWTLASVCRAIQTLLSHPEADSPLNCDAGNMIRAGDHEAFTALARFYAIEHAGAAASEWPKD